MMARLLGYSHGDRGARGVCAPASVPPAPVLRLKPRGREQDMIEILSTDSDKIVAFKMSGKLHDADYKEFVPALEAAIEAHGKIRMLAQFHDFHGWDLHAMWDDTKFAAKHLTEIERIALVGEKTWEKWMAKVCRPFTLAKIRYFDVAEIDQAWEWIAE
jgi:hypothetical protein